MTNRTFEINIEDHFGALSLFIGRVPSQAGVATPVTMCFRSFCELFQNTKTA